MTPVEKSHWQSFIESCRNRLGGFRMTRFDADDTVRLMVENGVAETADGLFRLTPEFAALLGERIGKDGQAGGLTSAMLLHCPDCDPLQLARMCVGVTSFIGIRYPALADSMRRDLDALCKRRHAG